MNWSYLLGLLKRLLGQQKELKWNSKLPSEEGADNATAVLDAPELVGATAIMPIDILRAEKNDTADRSFCKETSLQRFF